MLVITAGIMLFHARRIEKSRLGRLTESQTKITETLDMITADVEADLNVLAGDEDIRDYLTYIDQNNDPLIDGSSEDYPLFTEALDATGRVEQANAHYDVALVSFASCYGSSDGCIIQSDGTFSDDAFSLGAAPWYVPDETAFYLSPAHLSMQTGDPVLSFVRPVVTDDAAIGMIKIDMALSHLVSSLDRVIDDDVAYLIYQTAGAEEMALHYPGVSPGLYPINEVDDQDVREAVSRENTQITHESWFGFESYADSLVFADTPYVFIVMQKTPSMFAVDGFVLMAIGLSVVLGVLLGFIFHRNLRRELRPLSDIEQTLHRIKNNQFSDRDDEAGFDNEISLLANGINQAAATIGDQLRSMDEKYRFDGVTGLKTLHAAVDEINRLLGETDSKTSVCLLEVDNIKSINVTKGRDTGDAILHGVAERLRSFNKDAFLYSVGGNQFMFICRDMASFEAIDAQAHRIMDVFLKPIQTEQFPVEVKTNMGIAVSPNDGKDIDVLFRKCNIALYEARKKGRGALVFYNDQLDARLEERVKMSELLTTALEKDELYLRFQPLVDNHTEIYGFEALVRWNSPELGEISPESFIADAEESHLILPIGKWVLEQACLAQTEFKRRLGKELVMSVNVSPVQMVHRDFPDMLSDVVKRTGIDPAYLTLEITENVFVQSEVYLEEAIRRLHGMGSELALDDFGTGYASLTYLQKIPFDKLKIDKSFVDGIFRSKKEHNIIATIVDLVHDLEMKVIAEGVEDRRQYEYLRQITTDIFQGYFFSKPLLLPDALDFVESFDEMPKSKRIDHLTKKNEEKDGGSQ